VSTSSSEPPRPVLRVVSGSPTAEELAALTAVVASASTAEEPPAKEPARRGGWSDPATMHRRPLLPGPNGWRAATR
jgi:hypothetical protein